MGRFRDKGGGAVIVTVPKIGTGSFDDPVRPDTAAEWWQIVEENENNYVIEILE